MKEQKEWRIIKEAPEYEVSTKGDVRRISSQYNLKGSIDKDGYPRVMLSTRGADGEYKKSKKITRFRHRLVAEAFIPNPNDLPIVNHKDEDKANCDVENLEWCTIKYNVNYGEGAKRRLESLTKIQNRGIFQEGKSVYVYDYKTKDFIGYFTSATTAAKDLDCDYRTIYKMLKKEGSHRQHHGMVFSYTPIEFDN